MPKLFKGFVYAFNGLKYALATQQNLRIHAGAAILAVMAGVYFRINCNEWLWISLCITLVVTAELLNTAIETVTDIVSPGYLEKAGRVKDVAAAAVVITAIFALATGLIIFVPKIATLF